MDPRYAAFIWVSFGVAALAVLWNVLSPRMARHQLRQRWSQAADEATEAAEREQP